LPAKALYQSPGLGILAEHTSRRYSLDAGSSTLPSDENARDRSALLFQRPPERTVRLRTAVSVWRPSPARALALLQRRRRTLQGAPVMRASATVGKMQRQLLSGAESTSRPQMIVDG